MIKCYRLEEGEWKIRRGFIFANRLEDAKWASRWALGKLIYKIKFDVSGVEYKPKSMSITKMESDMIDIIKNPNLYDERSLEIEITDEDLLL